MGGECTHLRILGGCTHHPLRDHEVGGECTHSVGPIGQRQSVNVARPAVPLLPGDKASAAESIQDSSHRSSVGIHLVCYFPHRALADAVTIHLVGKGQQHGVLDWPTNGLAAGPLDRMRYHRLPLARDSQSYT